MEARQWADTLALVLALTALPDTIAVPTLLVFLLWARRPTLAQISFTTFHFIVALSFASHTIWYIWRRIALGALAGALLGPFSHAGGVVILLAIVETAAGVSTGTPIVRDYAESLCEPGICPKKITVGVSLYIYTLVALQAASTLFQVGQPASTNNSTKGKKALALLRKSPLWYSVVRTWLLIRPGGSRTKVSLYPQLRFVEKDLVGFLVPKPSSLKFYIDGVRWLHVYCDDEKQFAVLYGLRPRVHYQVEISGYAPLRISTLNDCRDRMPQEPMPQLTLSDALETSENQLTEQRHRLRRTRRDNGKKLQAVKSEISTLTERLNRSRRGDERARKRLIASSDAVRQLQQEISVQSAMIESTKVQCIAMEKELSEVSVQLKIVHEIRETAFARHAKELEKIKASQALYERQIAKERERIALQQQQLHAIRREISESKKSIEAAVEAFLKQRATARKDKEQKRSKQSQEFYSTIEKLEDSARSFYAMVQQP